jgi:hypothetical protein
MSITFLPHANLVLSNNNLTVGATGGTGIYRPAMVSGFASAVEPFHRSYFEVRVDRISTLGNEQYVGIAKGDTVHGENLTLIAGEVRSFCHYFGLNGEIRRLSGTSGSGNLLGTGATYTTNDVIGVALDTQQLRIWFAKNGVWQVKDITEDGFDLSPTTFTPSTITAFVTGMYRGAASYSLVTGRFIAESLVYRPEGFFPYSTQTTIISGTVYEYNEDKIPIPGAYPVRAYDRETGELAAEVMSAANGEYALYGLPSTKEFYLVAVDTTEPFQRSGIADYITPTVMEE